MKIVGIVDEVTTCQLCGREDLKKTVAVMDDGGYVSYYGCECVHKVLGRRFTPANIERIGYANRQRMEPRQLLALPIPVRARYKIYTV